MFTSRLWSPRQVVELTLSGQRRTVLAAPDDLLILDVTKDGKLLVSRGEDQFRLMALVPGSKSEKDMSWLAIPPGTNYGRVSPDGNSILVKEADGKFSIYPVAGGPGKAVPGTVPEDEIIHWSADGRSVLIHRTGEVPARVERLDISTGKRVLFRELAPPSRAGVLDVMRVAFSDDERWYAYDYHRVLCRLSSVTGVK